MEYVMVIHQEPDGFSARFPDLPGCFTQADSLEELREHAREAVELYIEVLRDKGEPVPKPTARIDKVAVKAS